MLVLNWVWSDPRQRTNRTSIPIGQLQGKRDKFNGTLLYLVKIF